MSTKKYDVVCKTGSYQTPDGKTKNNYVNVGTILENEGREFMVMNRHFNPAGLPNPDNRATIILSFFEPKKQDDKPTPSTDDIKWDDNA